MNSRENNLNRREFLRGMAMTSILAVVGKGGFDRAFEQHRPFEFLVVGDSLVWGQGLLEKDKFYSLTTEWLENEAFGGKREVNLTVKAHSGATIRFDPKEAARYRAAGKDENFPYKGEVNVSSPSMFKQVDTAAAEFKSRRVERGADLVMLTAGITDIAVEGVLDPFGDEKELIRKIDEVCRDRVGSLLRYIAEQNPDAHIVVVGYYPILSEYSSRSKVFNGWLETLNVPGWLQGFVNNPVMRPIVFGKLLKKAIKRSRVWVAESERNLQAAVAAHNTVIGREQAVFVKSPLTEEHVVEAPNTKLFRMRKDGTVEDPLYAERKADCKAAFEELQKTTGIKYSPKRCSYAAVGHPDPAGARLYANAIIAELRKALSD